MNNITDAAGQPNPGRATITVLLDRADGTSEILRLEPVTLDHDTADEAAALVGEVAAREVLHHDGRARFVIVRASAPGQEHTAVQPHRHA